MATEALANKQTGEYTGPVKGAAVVLDATNGDVLALVSSPSFDPNRYMESSIYRQQLLTDADARTFQRAVFGQYYPAAHLNPLQPSVRSKTSSFPKKNIPVQKAIEMRAVDRCDAGFTHKEAPGSIDMQEALMYSCNIYFYEIARDGHASL